MPYMDVDESFDVDEAFDLRSGLKSKNWCLAGTWPSLSYSTWTKLLVQTFPVMAFSIKAAMTAAEVD